jgi:hypothetical protein
MKYAYKRLMADMSANIGALVIEVSIPAPNIDTPALFLSST